MNITKEAVANAFERCKQYFSTVSIEELSTMLKVAPSQVLDLIQANSQFFSIKDGSITAFHVNPASKTKATAATWDKFVADQQAKGVPKSKIMVLYTKEELAAQAQANGSVSWLVDAPYIASPLMTQAADGADGKAKVAASIGEQFAPYLQKVAVIKSQTGQDSNIFGIVVGNEMKAWAESQGIPVYRPEWASPDTTEVASWNGEVADAPAQEARQATIDLTPLVEAQKATNALLEKILALLGERFDLLATAHLDLRENQIPSVVGVLEKILEKAGTAAITMSNGAVITATGPAAPATPQAPAVPETGGDDADEDDSKSAKGGKRTRAELNAVRTEMANQMAQNGADQELINQVLPTTGLPKFKDAERVFNTWAATPRETTPTIPAPATPPAPVPPLAPAAPPMTTSAIKSDIAAKAAAEQQAAPGLSVAPAPAAPVVPPPAAPPAPMAPVAPPSLSSAPKPSAGSQQASDLLDSLLSGGKQ